MDNQEALDNQEDSASWEPTKHHHHNPILSSQEVLDNQQLANQEDSASREPTKHHHHNPTLSSQEVLDNQQLANQEALDNQQALDKQKLASQEALDNQQALDKQQLASQEASASREPTKHHHRNPTSLAGRLAKPLYSFSSTCWVPRVQPPRSKRSYSKSSKKDGSTTLRSGRQETSLRTCSPDSDRITHWSSFAV